MSIVAECPGFLQVFSDGSVKRFAPDITPASIEPSNGYKSKDVIIDHAKPVTARIFLPDTDDSMLPVLVYFHGGGFCIGSTTWAGYHEFLGGLCVRSRSLIVSVDYRLAPENRLPVAYDDCYSSIEWLSRSSELWLERANLSQVFLSGDSAGGNIVHQVALRTLTPSGAHRDVQVKGIMVIHPYFGSVGRIKSELGDDVAAGVAMNDMFWGLSLPEGSDRDYFGCNFGKGEPPEVGWGQFPATVVHVAGLDSLKERGLMYGEFLKKSGVKKVTVIVAEGESHVYHVFHPHSESTRLIQRQMSEFMNRP